MNKYERQQVKAIEAWKREERGVLHLVVKYTLAPITALAIPLAQVALAIIPVTVLKGAIEAADETALFLTDSDDICRDGKVGTIEELRSKELRLSDRLAEDVRLWAIGMAGAEGVAAGVAGAPGLAIDIPALVTLSMRSIYKTGMCYGFEHDTELDHQFALGVLAVATSNSHKERMANLETFHTIEEDILKDAFETALREMPGKQLAKYTTFFVFKNLAHQIGLNLAKKKAMQLVPAVGAVVGGSINAWHVNKVCQAARRLYQGRWLLENGKLKKSILA